MAAETWVWERVDEMLNRYDAHVDINCGTAYVWSGQLRLTLTNPENAPARSMVFFSAGGGDPEDVAEALLADAEAWLAESQQEPLLPPARMLEP